MEFSLKEVCKITQRHEQTLYYHIRLKHIRPEIKKDAYNRRRLYFNTSEINKLKEHLRRDK